MDQQPSIQVGTVVVATRRTGVCELGEVGVCYEVYELGGRPGYSFIFASGRYDGFSPDEVALMLHVTGTVCQPVSRYHFRNVRRLKRDFDSGMFASAFSLVGFPGVATPQ